LRSHESDPHWRVVPPNAYRNASRKTCGLSAPENAGVEMPDEFAKQQRAYLDSKLKDHTTYKNAGEVLAALNLK
jgi:hypothetical protein